MIVPLAVAVGTLVVGIAGVTLANDLLDAVVAVEVVSKAALLAFLAAGGAVGEYLILLIVADAVVVAVLMAVAIAVHRREGSIELEGSPW
ncbi:MAG: NADH-quinone oxidoreductase subunit K [Halococcoides sp.]